jgi:hypothetical protein
MAFGGPTFSLSVADCGLPPASSQSWFWSDGAVGIPGRREAGLRIQRRMTRYVYNGRNLFD